MAKKKRLTNNSDETQVASLLSGDSVFAIPYFQRPYKWKIKALEQLQDDLLSLVDESSDFHFLGAVIVHGRRSNPSDPDIYEVIDGQQRITTIFILLCAVVRVLCKKGEYSDAIGLFQKYLVIGRETNLPSNSKLHSGKDDRGQLNRMMKDLLTDKGFAERLGTFKYRALPATSSDDGRLWGNYKAALRFFNQQVENEGIDRLKQLYSALLESISVVQIDVSDPTNGPKIFDSLNSRQAPMTIGDLVRNEIFAKVAGEDPATIESIDQEFWQPFYNKFKIDGEKSLFDGYFFPFGLIQDPNVKKSEVYAKLHDKWQASSKTPQAIISELAEFQEAYLDAACGTNRNGQTKPIASALNRLYLSNAPGSTYPFLMRLSNALRDGKVSEKEGLFILDVVESFLVRRALCGHEPTGLHSVFKRLWVECGNNPDKDKVEQVIRGYKTVVWPSDDDVRKAVMGRAMYGSNIVYYYLAELNRAAGGDQPTIPHWVEHVLPEKPSSDWLERFDEEQHKRLKDVLANLLPLSQEMNQKLGNSGYSIKRPHFLNDSGYKVTREFASGNDDWTPEALESRSKQLADWTVKRWSV